MWIGENVTLLPGVSIGEGAVVGACSVVAKDIPAYSVAVGNPARVIKTRDVERFNRNKEANRIYLEMKKKGTAL